MTYMAVMVGRPSSVSAMEAMVLAAVIDLRQRQRVPSLDVIAERTNLSRSTADNVIGRLRRKGLLTAEPGKRGTLRPVVIGWCS